MPHEAERIEPEAEILHLPPPQREELMQASRRRMLRAPGFRATVAAGLLSVPVLAAAAAAILFRRQMLLVYAVAFAAEIVLVRLVDAFVRRSHRSALRAEMLERGVRPLTCFDCGYDVRGDFERCPECGAVVQGAGRSGGGGSEGTSRQ